MANEEIKRGGIGKIVQIIGAVVDVRFKKHELPRLLNAIECDNNGQKLVLEVAQHIGDDIVRCIAMSSTDGLVRGLDAVDTGSPICVPVAERRSAECSICSAIRLMSSPHLKHRSAGRSTARHLPMRSR